MVKKILNNLKKGNMGGFKKINIDEKTKKVKATGEKKKFKFGKGIRIIGLVFLLIFIAISAISLLFFVPAKNFYFATQKAASVGQETYQAVKNQDIEKATQKLAEFEQSLMEVEKKLKPFAFIKYVPLIGGYEKDAEHLVKASIAGVSAGKIAADAVVPYADLLGLKGKSTFVSGSADDRIQTAVATLDKVTPKLEEISDKLAIVGRELDEVDPDRYPKKLGSLKVRDNLKLAKELFSQNAKLFVDARPLLSKIPDILGTKEEKTYLILFQNDAELRATGGFITAYAIFRVDKGKIAVVRADDIYKLDEMKGKSYPAPEKILTYHKDVSNFQLRDNNLSPDFVVSMKSFEEMLKESVDGFPEFDGIIALDTHVLAKSIEILGEFNIYGRTFSAENDPRCDCPKAIYELEDYSTRPVAYVREDRKDIIGVLLYQVMQRALGVSPSKYWGSLFQMFLDEATQKHILFYFHDEEAQKGLESLNFAGRIKETDKDYLHVNDVNFAGAKSNLFVEHFVKQEIDLASGGVINKTLTIDYKNPAKASNCNLEAGQLCLNGILRNWVRIYVPKGSKLIEFTGSEMDVQTYDELGKTVFEGFMTVKPQGAAQLKVTYELPFKASGEPYKLLIQKQPGTEQHEYTLLYKGKQVEKIPLLTDKEYLLKK